MGWNIRKEMLRGKQRPQIVKMLQQGAQAIIFTAVLFGISVAAQTTEQPKGVESGNYVYQGSFDIGYRFVDTSGATNVYETFVNQHEGPRFLDQTLSIQSRDHIGTVFDNLYVSSFGWGGDAENASRVRISKNKWYNLNFSFRRDQNFWDYNLLANPLNPPNSFINASDTPHSFLTRRRWYDTNLILAPQSPVRLRLGYSRNVSEGPSFSSIHEGTDALLFQPWHTTLNAYQIGVDFRLLPRTNISYDQFLQYYKGDTSWVDNTLGFQLSNGTLVDAGLIYNAAANQPCSNAPLPIFDPATTPPTLRATCNGYLAYSRTAPLRNRYPVEQLTIQSNYFTKLDLSLRGSYSSAESKFTQDETFAGLISRTAQLSFSNTGPGKANRIVGSLDLGVTWHVTPKLRFVDAFRTSNLRIPGITTVDALSFYGNSANMLAQVLTFSPVTCPPPFTAATCPKHGSSSPADVATNTYTRFLGQQASYNTLQAEYDVNKLFGARLGYRYGHRIIPLRFDSSVIQTYFPSNPNRLNCVGVPLNPDGTCSFSGSVGSGSDEIDITEQSGLFGLWARPTDALRFNFDAEILSADHTSTRISPRQLQHYKLRGVYKPRPWMNLSATMNWLESRNNVTEVFHREHNRNAGFSAQFVPDERFSLDLGYNYNDIFSTTNICYTIGAAPPGSTPCPSGGSLISGISTYDNRVHFAYGTLMVKPVKRVSTNFGYNLVSNAGNTFILTPTQGTLGPLGFNYHKPFASIGIELARGWSWITAWNYYGYNEKSDPGLVLPRDFHANHATISLHYEF